MALLWYYNIAIFNSTVHNTIYNKTPLQTSKKPKVILYLYNFDSRNSENNRVQMYSTEPPNLVRLKVDFGCEIPKCLGKWIIKRKNK